MMLASFFKSVALLACMDATEPRMVEAPAIAENQTEEVAALLPRNRLRKLHLVRPDLIPYPISFEVYC